MLALPGIAVAAAGDGGLSGEFIRNYAFISFVVIGVIDFAIRF